MSPRMIITLSVMLVFYCAQPAISGPTELSETQMTDMSVDNTVAPDTQKEDDNTSSTIPLKTQRPQDLIKNPVDNPAEINTPEILRLDKQAADQRVSDQIHNTVRSFNPSE